VVGLAALSGLLIVALAAYFWRKAGVLTRDRASLIGSRHRTFVERWGYLGYKAIALFLVAVGVSAIIGAAIR
jgi:hypothetical protein